MQVFIADECNSWIEDPQDDACRFRLLMRVDCILHGNAGLHQNFMKRLSELETEIVGPEIQSPSHCSRKTFSFASRQQKQEYSKEGHKKRKISIDQRRQLNETVRPHTNSNSDKFSLQGFSAYLY